MCTTADRGPNNTFKETILETCDIRADRWADEVRVRVEGCLSDLHAADARYHNDCKRKFMAPKSLESSSKMKEQSDATDQAIGAVIADMDTDKQK